MKRFKVLVIAGEAGTITAAAELVDRERDLELVGPIGPPSWALGSVERHEPDVVVVDVDPFGSAALDAIAAIMAERPTPILVVTAEPRPAQMAEAIRAGALDAFVLAPSARRTDVASHGLRERLLALAATPVVRHVARGRKPAEAGADDGERPPIALIAIAASTGGPKALSRLLGGIPADFPAAIAIVQHLQEGFAGSLVGWLSEASSLPVKVASAGRIEAGVVHLAPDDVHLVVARAGRFTLTNDEPLDGHRPSGNLLLESAARAYGAAVAGVILTGMGNDGARGLESIRAVGGRTLVQDEATSLVFGMPRAAWEAGAAEQIVPLDAIAPTLVRWARRGRAVELGA